MGNNPTRPSFAVLVYVPMACMAIYMARSEYKVQLRINEIRTENGRLTEEMGHYKRLRNQSYELNLRAYGMSNQEGREDQRVKQLLMSCTSRQDFLVREGPRIVWSELAFSSHSSKAMAVYLPSGKHRLTYSMSSNPRKDHYGSDLDSGYPERKTLFDFPSAPKVYELTVVSTESNNLFFRIKGDNDHLLLDHLLNHSYKKLGAVNLSVPDRPFSYPSQLKIDFYGSEEINSFCENGTTYLGEFQFPDSGNPNKRMLHLWLESESPLCMSAIQVAGEYTKALRWLNLREHGVSIVEQLGEVFYTYDGSDRFYLRSPAVTVPRSK